MRAGLERGGALSRRALLRTAAAAGTCAVVGALAAACGSAGLAPNATPAIAAPLPPPETTTLRIAAIAPCDPWYWLSDGFLREEGFTDIQYGKGSPAAGTADFQTAYGNSFVGAIDAGVPILVVGGMHTGCIEVFARPGIETITDLRGKTIAVNSKVVVTVNDKLIPDLFYGFLVSLFTHVGMQPSEANLVEIGADKDLISHFIDGKADAVMTVHAQGPLLKANPKNPGHVILDTSMDKPWSQNYCCLLITNRDWAKTNPVALKRATRALLRGVDAGKRDVRAAARAAADQGTYKDSPGFTEQVIYEVIRDESFDWRDYDPEETVRFFALRLADAKLIKKGPQQILSEGADLAYFRQLRKELKA